MEVTTEARETGVYGLLSVGMQQWRVDADSAWQAPGLRLEVRAGREALAVIKLECSAGEAEETAQECAAEIEPWVRTLRYLSVTDSLKTNLSMVQSTIEQAREEQEGWGRLEADTVDFILGWAREDEFDRSQDLVGVYGLGLQVLRRIEARFARQVAEGRRRALAHAPATFDGLHELWERPPSGYRPLGPHSLPQWVAAELLTGWALTRDQRDPLLTWAVKGAKLSRSEVQRITSVSRSTINRIIPDAG
ncbi:hypothetical protein FKN01_32020 [Streptomyces sp. 130]|uniref:hypothetical protein n=1 Tax=Streptomyces sp. 130 TaxID=2591006 RepID=UPI00117C498B|nr:hypothetical protein [Streptomyces sp. 130]TRV71241.1 hypothetical protein FKN01_32020 [Streptomyces sp. 130]